MDVFRTDRIRNVVLLGHGGAGKTTLTEAMAYLSGITNRLGKVTDGNTISDYDKEEIKRKFSISTSTVPVVWDKVKVNILDTPGFFDFVGEEEKKEFEITMPDVEEYEKEQLLSYEKEVLGFYVSGHPLEQYEGIWKKHITNVTADFALDEETGHSRVTDGIKATVGGMIVEKTIKYTRNNQTMAFLTVEDLLGTVEVVVFPRDYEKNKNQLVEDEKVFITGRVSVEEDKPSKLICEKIKNFKDITREVWIQFTDMNAYQENERQLYNILRESDGKDRVVIYVRSPKAVKRLSENWTVH